MQTPEDVQAMLKLASLGWGAKRITVELGCSRNTVRRYLRQGGWEPYQPPVRAGRLAGLRSGWRSGFVSTGETVTWCGRTWSATRASR